MSQHQKSADNMVLKELEKQKELQEKLVSESKRIAQKLRPQTSIDDLVHQAADESAALHKDSEGETDSSKTPEQKKLEEEAKAKAKQAGAVIEDKQAH